jgi:hypothetical protein
MSVGRRLSTETQMAVQHNNTGTPMMQRNEKEENTNETLELVRKKK